MRKTKKPVAKTEGRFEQIMKKTDGKVVKLKVADIIIGPDSRYESFNEQAVEEYAGLYKENETLLPPLYVEIMEDGTYVLRDGRHRHRACLRAALKDVRCLLFVGLTPEERPLLASISNLSKSPLRMTNEDILLNFKQLALPVQDGGLNASITDIREWYTGCVSSYRLQKLLNLLRTFLEERQMRKAMKDFNAGVPREKAAADNGIALKTFNRRLTRLLNPKAAEADLEDNEAFKGLHGKLSLAFANMDQQIGRWEEKAMGLWADGRGNIRTAQMRKFFLKAEKSAFRLSEKCSEMRVYFDKAAHMQ